jgi:hypothetical protein
MKTITKYQARDGCEFCVLQECVEYEQLLDRIDSIMAMILKRPDSTTFTNGGGYIKQDKDTIIKARSRFLDLASECLGRDVGQVSSSWLGRYLDDNNSPLYPLYMRLFYRIDQEFREWGQVYYANHPSVGVQKEYKP